LASSAEQALQPATQSSDAALPLTSVSGTPLAIYIAQPRRFGALHV